MSLMAGTRPNSTQRSKTLDLVICVDRSGSMGYGRKRTKLSEANRLTSELIKNLLPEDRVAIVTFNSVTNTVLPLTPVSQLQNFEARLERIPCRGNTCLIGGVKTSRKIFNTDYSRNKRLIILSDGRTNISFDGSEKFEGSANLENELKDEYNSIEQENIETAAIAIGTDAFIMPLKNITNAMKGRLILDGPGNIQHLAEVIRTDAMFLPLAIKAPLLEKTGLDVVAIPSDFTSGQQNRFTESLNEHVAIVSEAVASTYPKTGVTVSNSSNQRFARVALASITDNAFRHFREKQPEIVRRVRAEEVILLDKSYLMELEIDEDDVVDLKV